MTVTAVPEATTAPSRADLLTEVWAACLPSATEIHRGRRRLHAKATAILVSAGGAYWALVIADSGPGLRALAAGVLVAALISTATGVMHDANHGSFSRHRWFNRVAACSADLLGASAWLWRFKHNHLHHGNTNVDGVDSDLQQEPFARLAPNQQWRPWHRWQHLYLWFLYGFFALKNVLFGDLRNLGSQRVGSQPLPAHHRGLVTARVLVGKVLHVLWAVVVPMMFNPWWKVLAFYAVCSWLVGFFLAVTFQLAHCVDIAGVVAPDAPRRGRNFVEHQVLTTVDIASPVPVVGHAFRWLVGGLDHQLEHHLAPRLPHTVYPAVARRFHRACRDTGIALRRHPGLWAALRSHTRWLVEMGRQPLTA